MQVFDILVGIVAIAIVVAALLYTRSQFAGNKHIVDQYRTSGSNNSGSNPVSTSATRV